MIERVPVGVLEAGLSPGSMRELLWASHVVVYNMRPALLLRQLSGEGELKVESVWTEKVLVQLQAGAEVVRERKG